MDKARKSLSPDESFFMLNHETANPSSLGKGVPMAANYPACAMDMGAGENYEVGTHYAPLTNEAYSWHYNSNGVHFISRINGDGVCEVVYSGNCLSLSADPAHEIKDWRAYMWVEKICHNRDGRQLIWVDGSDTPIGMLDVEASIATNFFTTPFFDVCNDSPCSVIEMCVPEPDGCLHGSWVAYDSVGDAGLTNRMLDKGLKFMYRYVYYDLRASEWSDRSSLYYQDARGCFDNSEGFSRCMKFSIPVGNPLVDKIEFAVSEDGGVTWFLYDTIEKYSPYVSTTQKWYERTLLGSVNTATCTIDYIFCNDKERTPIDHLALSREFNPMPRSPQGLMPVKQSLGFYNYLKGSCPVDKNEADKFQVDIDCPDEDAQCNIEIVKVTVRAIIYNEHYGKNGFIYRLGGGDGVADDTNDPAWFGTTVSGAIPYIVQGYDQTFSDKTRNFIAYIEGTKYQAEMVQYRSTPDLNSHSKVGVLGGLGSAKVVGDKESDIRNGNFYYQECTFNVPKGTKGFIRLASHHQTNGVGASQNTSTQVVGVWYDLHNYRGNTTLLGIDDTKEIYFDACEGDVDYFNAFIVADLFTADLTDQSSAYSGYITDKNNQPVEGARIYHASTMESVTDFNGFYSFYKFVGTSAAIFLEVKVEQNCTGGWATIETFSSQSSKGAMGKTDYKILSDSYANGFYAPVNVSVTDCNGRPVGGVRIAMSGSKYKSTHADGIAHFKLRNYATRDRYITAVVMDKGGCFTLNCAGDCNPCMPSNNLLMPACFEHLTEPLILPMLSRLNTASLTSGKTGLKHGGRYGLGWVAEGDCGRLSAVNQVRYIDVPRAQQSGGLGFCSFAFNGNGIKLPSWVKRLKIVRTANLNPYNLQWVVDAVDRTSDGKIKLTIQSLNDYNAQYNFKTNAVYKYFAGDRVEFIRNGDGKLFDTATYGVLNYLTLSPFNDQVLSGVTNDANYFNQLLIADDGKLDGLVAGAVIEIQTPATISSEPAYYEICASVDVTQVANVDGSTHGELTIGSGTFSSFDTFLVSRQIGKFPVQFFESKSPSDFWGMTSVDNTVSFLDDTGKVHFVNKYENEKRYGRNITINSPTQFNYFGDSEKHFEGGQDDITALVLKDDKIGAGITQNNNFLFEVSDQLLRVGADNVIRATTADSFISNPQAKLRGEYGCSYADIGSIFFGDGFFTYVDVRNSAYVIHDYQLAKEAGEDITTRKPTGVIESTCSSFFRKRVTDKENFNKTSTNFLDHYRYSTGMNKSTGALYLTTKSLRMSGINNEKEVYAAKNDTIVYNPANDTFLGFASFTAEGYSQLNLNNETGCAFIAYQNSLPYIHPVIADKWNEFFGVAVDEVVGVSVNGQSIKMENKIKIPISAEVQSDAMWYVQKVTTEMLQTRSEIPAVRWKKNQDGKWNASFLNDINSRGGLYNGASVRGYVVNVVFVKDNTINLQYGTIDNNKRVQYNEMDSVLIKVSISAQSGFDENL